MRGSRHHSNLSATPEELIPTRSRAATKGDSRLAGLRLDLRAMAEGLPAGQSSGLAEISRDELRRRLGDPRLVVVDVLARDSYLLGHIPGALTIPLAELPERAREMLPNLETEIAVYCAKFT